MDGNGPVAASNFGMRRLLALASLAVTAVLLATLPLPANADPAANPSVINGQDATIAQYPWQVGLLNIDNPPYPDRWNRQFCGGALIAPTMVVTAAHCVANEETWEETPASSISVLTGINDLSNETDGAEITVADIFMPRDDGTPIYLTEPGWDVALLKLSSAAPMPALPVKLAGPDEQDLLKAGSPLTVTGWGADVYDYRAEIRHFPEILQQGSLNVQPAGPCRQYGNSLRPFTAATDICTGDVNVRVDSCVGDSGGPITAGKASEPRLIGVVSRGTDYFMCEGRGPAIDTAVAKQAVRDWISGIVTGQTGVDPVGSGATQPALPNLARVPMVARKLLKKARKQLKKAGFKNIKVKRIVKRIPRKKKPKKPRVMAQNLVPGWLAKPNARFVLQVKVEKRKKKKRKR